MEQIQRCLDNNQNVEGQYLTYLLSSTQMDMGDVYGSIAELLLAGVDTVKFLPWNTYATYVRLMKRWNIFLRFLPLRAAKADTIACEKYF